MNKYTIVLALALGLIAVAMAATAPRTVRLDPAKVQAALAGKNLMDKRAFGRSVGRDLKAVAREARRIAKRDDAEWEWPETLDIGNGIIATHVPDSFDIGNKYAVNFTTRLDPSDPRNDDAISVAFVVFVGNAHVRAIASGDSSFHPATIINFPGGPGDVMHGEMSDAYSYVIQMLGNIADNLIPELDLGLDLTGMPSLLDTIREYDFVTFDVRGSGHSCGMSCMRTLAKSAATDMFTDSGDVLSVALAQTRIALECRAEILLDNVQQLKSAETCIVGSRRTPGFQRMLLMPHLDTQYVVQDTLAFVDAVGYSSMVVMGGSYGTLAAQACAALVPDRVEFMILDGPFYDNTMSAGTFAGYDAANRRLALDRYAALCAADDACRIDACGDGVDHGVEASFECASRAFNFALNASTSWPKEIDMTWFNPITEQVETTHYTLGRSQTEQVMAQGLLTSGHGIRGHVIRMLLKAYYTDDYSDFAKYRITALEKPLPARSSDYTADDVYSPSSIHMSSDFMSRSADSTGWFLPSPFTYTLSYYDDMLAYPTAPGVNNINAAFGALSAWFEIDTVTFARDTRPFSVALQNATTTIPGSHAYPVLIGSADTDMKSMHATALRLRDHYAATGVGEAATTSLVVANGGAHGALFMWMADPAPDLMHLATAALAMLNFIGIPMDLDIPPMVGLPEYYPASPATPVTTADEAAKYTVQNFLRSHEFAFGSKPGIYGNDGGYYLCKNGGTITWAPVVKNFYHANITDCSEYAGWVANADLVYSRVDSLYQSWESYAYAPMFVTHNGGTPTLVQINEVYAW